MPSTTKAALPYPSATDSPNGPLQFQNLALALDLIVVPRFTTLAARDAAFPTPAQGDMCNVAGMLQTYRAGDWRYEASGFTTATTDASGLVSVAHPLLTFPTGARFTLGPLATNALMNVADLKLAATNATTITGYLSRTDTNVALPSQQVSFSWSAFR